MYCVIQKVMNKKVMNKKPDSYGEAKELKVSTTTITFDGKTETEYSYTYGSERFQRTHKEAYKISIHKSYRENGKVKKKQWVICTMSYYDLIEFWPGDCIGKGALDNKLAEIEITEDELWELVYKKLDPIIAAVKKEFEATEEYKTHEKHRKIIDKYLKKKEKFEKKYGQNTYDYCYDVFGVLRNEAYLKELQASYDTQQQYYKDYYSSYFGKGNSNYSSNDYSGYFQNKQSNHTEDEKEKLKKIYKVLALKFHPDHPDGDADMMKFVNKLKEEWGI